MVDCHVHMVLDGVDWRAAVRRHEQGVDEKYIRAVLARWQAAGFTYLRDGGDKWGVSAFARRLAPEYGIVYRSPLAPISKLGHYGAFIGEQFGDLKEYAAMVSKRRCQGADHIKIMISGLMDLHRFGVLTEDGLAAGEIREMVHIAHEEGFAVMAHANGARVVEAAAAAGVDSVEHGAYLDGDALRAMAENGVIWVPTLSTLGNLLEACHSERARRIPSDGAVSPNGGSFVAGAPQDDRSGAVSPNGGSFVAGAPQDDRREGIGRFDRGAVREILDCAMENVCRFAQMGGLVASGSDAGAWAVMHAVSTEYMLLACSGVSDAVLEMGAKKVMEKF